MLLVLGLAACGSTPAAAPPPAVAPAAVPANPARPVDCAAPPPADPTTATGWAGYVAARPDDVGVVVDDGRGGVVSHRADAAFPLASAVKVVHLAAYGRAVAEGRVRPDEPVAVTDWERWYLPDTDGGAHPAALARLRPGPTVTLEQLVSAMIQESDNAATDWLRDRLGDDALTRAAADVGWTPFDLPSELGGSLALVLPEMAPPVEAPRAERGPVEVGLARRYAADPAFRAEAQRRLSALAGDVEGFTLAEEAWAPRTAAGTPAQLAATYRALATGSYGPGSDVALRQLEWQGPTPGVGRLGFKGGSLAAGVLTFGASLRRDDGSVATMVVLARGLPRGVTPFAAAQQRFALGAVRDPAAFRRLVCVA